MKKMKRFFEWVNSWFLRHEFGWWLFLFLFSFAAGIGFMISGSFVGVVVYLFCSGNFFSLWVDALIKRLAVKRSSSDPSEEVSGDA